MLCEIETALAGIRAGLLADLETMGAGAGAASLQCGFRNRALAVWLASGAVGVAGAGRGG